MRYEIVKGLPTADEMVAIEFALRLHKRKDSLPVIQASTFGRPQLRKPIVNSFRFGRKN